MVIFGDSVISDPNMGQWAAGKLGLDPRGPSDIRTWCPTSPTSWGKRSAAKLGLPTRDYSCTGTVSIQKGPQFASEVTRAVNDRGLSPATARVIITTGFNDTYHNDGRDRAAFRRDWVAAMAPQIRRIRAAAPNARIQIVGYPKITDGDRVCLFHIAPNTSDWTRYQDVQRWENLAQWMEVDAARAAGHHDRDGDLRVARERPHLRYPLVGHHERGDQVARRPLAGDVGGHRLGEVRVAGREDRRGARLVQARVLAGLLDAVIVLLYKGHVAPGICTQCAGVVIGITRDVIAFYRVAVPLLARDLARLAADADRGVGEEPLARVTAVPGVLR